MTGRSAGPSSPEIDHLAGVCRLLFLVMISSAAFTMFAGSFGPGGTTPWWVAVLVFIQATAALAAQYRWQRSIPLLMAHPGVLFVGMAISGVVLPDSGAPGPVSFMLFAICLLAGLLYDWRGRLLFPVTGVLGWLLLAFRPGIHDVSSVAALYGTPLFLVLATASGVFQRRLLDRQASTERALRAASRARAMAEERTRIARDMHDSIIKTMHGIGLRADGLVLWAQRDPTRITAEARQLALDARTAAVQVRGLIGELRAPVDPSPVATQMDAICRAWSTETGIPVTASCEPVSGVEPQTAHELRMVLGEALENVRRHASASRVEVRLLRTDGNLVLQVTDDGCGITASSAAPSGGFGLIGMRERSHRVGGTLTVEPGGPTGGTRLQVRVPIPIIAGDSPNTAAVVHAARASPVPSEGRR